ncbi:hypothetical protein I4F81_010363 [Pyropia yezoensis]|uniref:Uncharacterized protein n=1 Tax=Pyropia yezoensis TaxID=2788 RepID=A0ACC3CD01_PYRYE|nr:hypothetical protein I4F81_010363 [Neopyropia yezoensis]
MVPSHTAVTPPASSLVRSSPPRARCRNAAGLRAGRRCHGSWLQVGSAPCRGDGKSSRQSTRRRPHLAGAPSSLVLHTTTPHLSTRSPSVLFDSPPPPPHPSLKISPFPAPSCTPPCTPPGSIIALIARHFFQSEEKWHPHLLSSTPYTPPSWGTARHGHTPSAPQRPAA